MVRRFANITTTILFLCLIAISFLGLGVPKDSNSEQRVLAAFPVWSDDTRTFLRGIETYVADRFGMREQYLTLDSRMNYALFGVSSSDRVIAGNDAWLFYADDGSLRDLLGKTDVDEDFLRSWSDSIGQRDEWLEARGAEYRVVVAPDKHSVYPGHLPKNLRVAGTTRLDRIVDHVRHPALMDLRPTLDDAVQSSNESLYFRTDTHWTSLGAKFAADRLLESLQLRAAAVTNREVYNLGGPPRQRDLAVMSKLDVLEDDTFAHTVNLVACRPVQARLPAGIDPAGVIISAKQCRDDGPTTLVFHDSFMVSLAPYLEQQLGRVIYVWARPSDDLFVRLVEQENPDIVIEERVERYMQYAPTSDLDGALQRSRDPVSRGLTTEMLRKWDDSYKLVQDRARIEADRILVGDVVWGTVSDSASRGGLLQETRNLGEVTSYVGWSAFASDNRKADFVVLVKNSKVLFIAPVDINRPDVAAYVDSDNVNPAGFDFKIPNSILDAEAGDVRLFALTGRTFAELDNLRP